MEVPLLDLKRQYEDLKKEIDSAIQRVVDSQYFILGEEVEMFEKEVANFCGTKHAIGVASGTDALKLALEAAGVGEGRKDKVITSPFTYFATAGSIVNAGAEPVFVDIKPDTFNIDPEEVQKVLEGSEVAGKEVSRRSRVTASNDYKAIIPVHLFGQMADMESLLELSEEYNLTVVEDAAQSIGSEYRGKKAGTLGDAGCFSFFPTKNLGGYGDGGMVITDEDEYEERLRKLRVHGSKKKYYNEMIGYNSRLDAIQAAVLSAKLPYLEKWSRARKKNALLYNEFLIDSDEIVPPAIENDRSHIFHQYTIKVPVSKRDELLSYLGDNGIGNKVYYPIPLHLQSCFSYLGYERGDFPVSEEIAEQVLSLPIFPELREEEIEYVSRTILEFFN